MLDHNDTDATTAERPPAQVEVRRNVPLAAALAGIAGLLAIAFAVRAFGGGSTLDWLLLAVLVLVTGAWVVSLIDSRAPLMVVDDHGVRLRQGATWQGVAWPDVDCLEHLPRRLPLRDGHLLVVGYDEQQLVVPLTMATRVVGAEERDLGDVLAGLADGRADVVEVVPGLDDGDGGDPTDGADGTDESSSPESSSRVDAAFRGVIPAPTAAPSPGREDTVDLTDTGEDAVSTGELEPVQPAEKEVEDHSDDAAELTDADDEPPAPGRPTVYPARVEVDRPTVSARLPRPADSEAPSGAPSGAPSEGPSSASSAETMTVVLDDLAVQPAATPVIGPTLAEARDRLRLTIDQLSERTRIRPHVLEAIEVDDFAPCGGDFYARGHLRTVARVLGVDAAPLVATYDEKYADAPVDPRRIFESELATGVGGSIRSTRGGRNWSVLIAAVMAAVLVWSLAKLFMGGPAPVGHVPVLNQSGGIAKAAKAKGEPVKVTLTAAGGGAHLVVRDATGDIVMDGPLAFGQTSVLHVVPPVRIYSDDGSVTAAIGKGEAQPLGKTGEEVNKTLISH